MSISELIFGGSVHLNYEAFQFALTVETIEMNSTLLFGSQIMSPFSLHVGPSVSIGTDKRFYVLTAIFVK